MTPRVSICIPAYNYGRYLAQAIASAQGQTLEDIEIIVSDNRSSDDSREIVAHLAAGDARIRYSRAAEHLPMHENFNRCLALARAPYIKYLCADDTLESRCVARMLERLEERAGATLVACTRRFFRDSGGTGGLRRYASTDVDVDGKDAIRRCYFYGNLIGEPTAVMFRAADAHPGFNARLPQLVDLEMWFRLLEKGRLVFIAEPLCGIRQHSMQATHKSTAAGRITADKAELYREFGGKPYVRGSLAERLLWDLRMAWSAQRERAAGYSGTPVEATYLPALRGPIRFAAAIAWRLGAGR